MSDKQAYSQMLTYFTWYFFCIWMKFVSKVLVLNKLLCECMKAGPQEEHNDHNKDDQK